MKKWFIAFLVVIIIVAVSVYLFIPGKIEIARTAYVNAPPDVAYRNVSQESGWKRWWPSENYANKEPRATQREEFVYDDIKYAVTSHSLGPVEIHITTNGSEFGSTLLVIPLKKDSAVLHWKCIIETGNNPIQKIKYYGESKKIERGMNNILDSLQSFLGRKENLYNILIERAKVTDTILVTSKITLDHYPTTAEVYNEINKLKQYISSQGVKETNYPMLHVLKSDSNHYETMVAIPVSRRIENNVDFVSKRMVPGNILVARVRGGRHSIEKAFAEMETYVKDHELIPPAIPFESLETDRLKEPDTTKWITRIYFPIL